MTSVIPLKWVGCINPETLSELPDQWEDVSYADLAAGDPITGRFSFKRISRTEAPTRARRLAQQGDVLIASLVNRDRVLHVYRAPEATDIEGPLVYSTGFFTVRASPKLNSRFLFYLLMTHEVQNELRAVANGVTILVGSWMHIRETDN